jgi:hypothetical protein
MYRLMQLGRLLSQTSWTMRTSFMSHGIQSVAIVIGRLTALNVEYVRRARYPTRRQTESHRTPRYRVRFQIEGEPAQEAMVGPNPPAHLVSTIRGSGSGDVVEIVLSADAGQILGWTNKTSDALWHGVDTWGESD